MINCNFQKRKMVLKWRWEGQLQRWANKVIGVEEGTCWPPICSFSSSPAHCRWPNKSNNQINQTSKQTNKQIKQTKWMKYQVIGDQSKEEKIWNLHYIGISLGKKERKKGKNRVISVNLSGFQQIQVQEKWIKNRPNQRGEIRHLSFEYKGKGKERIGERYRQKEEKFENLRDFQQIQVKFYQLFATVIRWSLWKFEKNWQKSSLVWLT